MGKDNADVKKNKSGDAWTRVSNAHSLEIYVRVTTNIDEVLAKNFNDMVKIGSYEVNDRSVETQMQYYLQQPGFVKICPGEYLDFFIAGPDGRVFVTVRTEAEETADNFPIQNNCGIVVNKKGCIQLLKADSVWCDKEGRNHEPNTD